MICVKLKLNLHGNNKLCMYWTYEKKLFKYPYSICCKLKLNYKLFMYWTYTLLSWLIFQNFLKFYFQIKVWYLYAQKHSSYMLSFMDTKKYTCTLIIN
jgi:hypothetical protein